MTRSNHRAWSLCTAMALVAISASTDAVSDGGRWWPIQQVPAGIVRTTNCHEFAAVKSPNGRSNRGWLGANHMLAQSLAGLAAQAVNGGTSDELVWIAIPSDSYERWYAQQVARLHMEERGVFDPWQLLQRYDEKGLVKGYVLYSYDYSVGHEYERREDVDQSVNVATVMAGLTQSVLIEEGQEERARQLGLERRGNARGKDIAWCFREFKDKLNRHTVLTVDPRVPHNRALAIAQRCMVFYDTADPAPAILEWVEPVSPVLGWNCGGEIEHTEPLTRFGLFQTASNWVLNLPVLLAGTEKHTPTKLRTIDPKTIDYDQEGHYVSFIMSDGDNVGWMVGGFGGDSSYWGNPHHGEFGFGWTVCPTHLAQVCPGLLDHLAQTQPAQTSFYEHGGGYQYPDIFAEARADRPTALRAHADKISSLLNQTNVRLFSFICKDVDSPAALEAYRIYARRIEGLTGMVALQYYPYEGGHGEIFWAPNAQGADIPILTPRYSLWTNAYWDTAGTPAKVARMINEATRTASRSTTYTLVAAHAWSSFQLAPGPDEDAENVHADADPKIKKKGVHGLTPVKWCVDRFDPAVKVITPEEMLWRIRMDHNTEQTRQVLSME